MKLILNIELMSVCATYDNCILVIYDTVHIFTNLPPFGARGGLTFYISISSYTITPFSLFFSIIYTTGISEGEVTFGATSP